MEMGERERESFFLWAPPSVVRTTFRLSRSASSVSLTQKPSHSQTCAHGIHGSTVTDARRVDRRPELSPCRHLASRA
eukprot:scaffold245_cov256-Pinguiococcus_pyrenoidosus.AAC.39